MQFVMFDVDGTLVDSTPFDSSLYAESLERVLGVAIDRNWSAYEHVSDSGILAEVLRRSRPVAEHALLKAQVEEYFVERVRSHLVRAGETVREIAGAKRLVERLLALPEVSLAIATGGWERTARLKLEHIGIPTGAVAFASSSDAYARTDIMRLAAARAARAAPFTRTVYFGDGPWDLRACAELGYEFCAVGTAVVHESACRDFTDADAILGRLELARQVEI